MLGSLFKANRPASLKNHIITFVDLIDSLQCFGYDVLKNQLDVQKKFILDKLRDSGIYIFIVCVYIYIHNKIVFIYFLYITVLFCQKIPKIKFKFIVVKIASNGTC